MLAGRYSAMEQIDNPKSFAADKKRRNTYAGISACVVLLCVAIRITLPVTVGSILLGIGIFLFTGKKWVRWTVIPLCIGFNLATSYLFGFPVKYLMPLEGYIKDVSTGEPIPNAIFDVEYIEYRPTVTVTVVGRDIDHAYVVSGKDGRYLIGGRFFLDFMHPNTRRHLKLRHPLYETAEIFLNRSDLTVVDSECRKKERAANIFHLDTCKITFKSKSGRIRYDVGLESLKEKYRDNRKVNGVDITWVLFDEMLPYAAQAKKMGLPIEWRLVFQEWDKILLPFGEYKGTAKAEIMRIVG